MSAGAGLASAAAPASEAIGDAPLSTADEPDVTFAVAPESDDAVIELPSAVLPELDCKVPVERGGVVL